ncbi:lytic transglycosylase domain-containing protein [Albidovulum sp.]
MKPTSLHPPKTWRRLSRLVLLGSVLAFSGLPSGTRAAAAPEQVCDAAAHVAAAGSGVPAAVLMAITRTETGRGRRGRLEPWPWTVNMEGRGIWFDDLAAARAYVLKAHERGARSFDIGCFQINYRWHGEAFRSIDEMFDPVVNARYAARFLRQLYAETGSWAKAAGAFHSRTPGYAQKYQARFERILASLDGAEAVRLPVPVAAPAAEAPAAPAAPAADRANRFPLLLAGAPRGLGSLVPVEADPGPGLFAAAAPLIVAN